MKKFFQNSFKHYSFEFIQDKNIPDLDLVTCVFAFVKSEWKIFLTKNHRWWELPWWHIEKWESLENALQREMKEEIWATVKNIKFFWYKKIINFEKIKNREWWFYPFPNSYILFYVCDLDEKNVKIDCEDTLDYWEFDLEKALDLVDEDNKKIIEIIYKYKF